jgi:hypothetical protein
MEKSVCPQILLSTAVSVFQFGDEKNIERVLEPIHGLYFSQKTQKYRVNCVIWVRPLENIGRCGHGGCIWLFYLHL